MAAVIEEITLLVGLTGSGVERKKEREREREREREKKKKKERKKESEVARSCLALCSPMDCSLPGSSVDGVFQARILEWVAISFPRRSS